MVAFNMLLIIFMLPGVANRSCTLLGSTLLKEIKELSCCTYLMLCMCHAARMSYCTFFTPFMRRALVARCDGD